MGSETDSMRNSNRVFIFLAAVLCAAGAWAQNDQPERVTVPFSDQARPKSLHVTVMHGTVSVKGYDGRDVIVEAVSEPGHSRHRVPDRAQGLHRIDTGGIGMTVEESDNVVTVTDHGFEHSRIEIQVPVATSLKLHSVNGHLSVDHISGDVEIETANGSANATHISGAATMHSMNGKINASLDRVVADKALSFSSMNGDIDVSLPPDVKTTLRMKNHNGAVYSDFDVATDSSSRQQVVESKKDGRARNRVTVERTTNGQINGGGPEIQLTTFNGNIYVRKAK